MHADSPLWLSEADVVSVLTLAEGIDVLEQALVAEHRGAAQNMGKTHVAWGKGHTLHAIGAVWPEAGFAGTKTWAHTAGGATPLLVLLDSHDGSLVAIIEAFALGQMRTGGISGVATRWLAVPDANTLAIIGTGKQALAQVAGVAAVRALQQVRVFSPTASHRAEFAARLRARFELGVSEAESVAAATRGAQIVTLVTRATVPFLNTSDLEFGTHINAVGAITPERAEFSADIFPRCAQVAADSVPAVRALSREFIDNYGGGRDWDEVVPLSRLVAERKTRPAGADLTLFKAMGMGVSDLALGMEVYRRAVTRGLGRRLPVPEKVGLRLGVGREA